MREGFIVSGAEDEDAGEAGFQVGLLVKVVEVVEAGAVVAAAAAATTVEEGVVKEFKGFEWMYPLMFMAEEKKVEQAGSVWKN